MPLPPHWVSPLQSIICQASIISSVMKSRFVLFTLICSYSVPVLEKKWISGVLSYIPSVYINYSRIQMKWKRPKGGELAGRIWLKRPDQHQCQGNRVIWIIQTLRMEISVKREREMGFVVSHLSMQRLSHRPKIPFLFSVHKLWMCK